MSKDMSEDSLMALSMIFEAVASCEFPQLDHEDQNDFMQVMRQMKAKDGITVSDINNAAQVHGCSQSDASKVVKFFEDAGIQLNP